MQLFPELEHCYLGAATITDRKIEIHKVKLSHPLYIKMRDLHVAKLLMLLSVLWERICLMAHF